MSAGGGLSASNSSSSSTGDQKSGDVGGSTFTFGGINTGKQSQNSALMIAVVAVAVVIGLVLVFKKR